MLFDTVISIGRQYNLFYKNLNDCIGNVVRLLSSELVVIQKVYFTEAKTNTHRLL